MYTHRLIDVYRVMENTTASKSGDSQNVRLGFVDLSLQV